MKLRWFFYWVFTGRPHPDHIAQYTRKPDAEPEWVTHDLVTGKQTRTKDTDKGKVYAIIAKGECPDCRSKKGFYKGPSGGMSTNVFCGNCGQGFNITPMIGTAEWIHKDERYIQTSLNGAKNNGIANRSEAAGRDVAGN